MASDFLNKLGSRTVAGATAGGTIGSAVPGIGTAIGTGIGAAAGAQSAVYGSIYDKIKQARAKNKLKKQGLSPQDQQQLGQGGAGGGGDDEGSFWGGRRAYNEQVPLFTGNQQAYQNQVIDQLRQHPADFGAIRQQELNRFQKEILPGIAEQYFGRNSSSFGSAYPEALGRGGADLATRLQAAQSRFEAEREARHQAIALQPSYTTVQHPREAGFGENALNNIAATAIPLAGKYAESYFNNKGKGPDDQDGGGGGGIKSPMAPIQGAQPTQAAQVMAAPYQETLSQLAPVSTPNAWDLNSMRNNGLNNLLQQDQISRNNQLGGRTR